jgi:hypothetical protein
MRAGGGACDLTTRISGVYVLVGTAALNDRLQEVVDAKEFVKS